MHFRNRNARKEPLEVQKNRGIIIMQIFIAKTLNKVLLLFSAVIVLFFAGIFAVAHYYPEYARWQVLAFIIASITLALFYRYLEENWDKRIIGKMAGNGKVALMNIHSGKRIMAMRDSSFKTYWIYELEGTLYNSRHEALEKTFQEKMNKDMDEIPVGSVYVTYDELKPAQIFIIPNAMIGSLPGLMPVVQGYEKDSAIEVKYLDAHYNKGMVLRTFKEAMNDYKNAQAEKKEKSGEKAASGNQK
jgi:membrane protein implicated in regulation of membrane protease activity